MTADTLKTTRVLELYQDFLSGKLINSSWRLAFTASAEKAKKSTNLRWMTGKTLA